jgi:2-polyprenyl-3-methyl-5-hydroxy-6-metoxy-1,4-benzoquinol methylase
MNKIVISPLSNSNNVRLIKTFEISEIIRRWKDEFNIDISKEFKEKDVFLYLYECVDSSLFFFEPRFEGSSDVYKELQKKFEWYYLEDKWEYKIAQNEIIDQKSIIEIGCGKGTFINKINKKSEATIIGLETSQEAVIEAQKKKLPVFLKDIGAVFIDQPNYEVDTIIAFQVLEHLAEPLLFLKHHISYLKKGGKLILCVPNIDCFYQYSDELLDMPPHHTAKWSKKSFKYLENTLPIKLKKVRYEPLFYMHIGIWLRNYSMHYRKEKWYGKYLFNKFTIPLFKKLLKTRLRYLIRGHSIYVSFEKTN